MRVERYLGFAFACADLLFEVGPGGRLEFVLGAARGISNLSDNDLLGKPWRALFSDDGARVVESLMGGLADGARCGPVTVELEAESAPGKRRRALFSACRLPGRNGVLSCALARRLSPLMERAEQLPRDEKTQLLQPEAFGDLAAHQVGEGGDTPVRLALVDMPQLDKLRSKLGASESEALIGKIGAVLRAASVGGAAAGQLGPTRFGVMQEEGAALGDLKDRLSDAAREFDADGELSQVEVGEVALDPGGMAAGDALKAVQYVLRRFADAPPGSTPPASLAAAFDDLVAETITRMQDFTSTVRGQDFKMVFQPVVDLATRQVHHHEALVRFADQGSPFEKIRFAEDIGLIEALDLAVCENVLDALEHDTPHDFSAAANISGRSLQNGAFVRALLARLDALPGMASRLLFEITESAEMKDLVAANETIQSLRRRGFKVCLDDFGAGAASFQYLQALQVDCVKIDGAYTKRLGSSPRDEAMLRGLVGMCRSLSVATVAEMVETEEQARLLAEMGVEMGQGWLFGKPQALAKSAGPDSIDPDSSLVRIRLRRRANTGPGLWQ